MKPQMALHCLQVIDNQMRVDRAAREVFRLYSCELKNTVEILDTLRKNGITTYSREDQVCRALHYLLEELYNRMS